MALLQWLMPDQPYDQSTAQQFRAFSTAIGAEVPLYQQLAVAIAEDDELLHLAGMAMAGQPPPNVLFASVQFLLLGGAVHPLAAWYPAVSGSSASDRDPVPTFRDFCREHRVELEALISSRRTQTNEVARCLALLPALAEASTHTDLPMSLIEVGASAGLLLAFDRYHYSFGDRQWGPAGSPVRLRAELHGEEPPLPAELPPIAGRVGIDLHPIDVSNETNVRWLEALVFPGHEDRRTRLRNAIAVVSPDPPRLLAGDALEILGQAIDQVEEGAIPVVIHSFALIQWTTQQRTELDRLLLATRRPILRIWLEWFGYDRNKPVIRIFQYRDGSASVETVGRFHHHGRWLDWGWKDVTNDS